VANFVPIHNKNGERFLCVDFRNINQVSLKDNYPFPKMGHILKNVIGAQRIYMMDGFFGYNKIVVQCNIHITIKLEIYTDTNCKIPSC
jgi:hypothetical protein